MSSPVLREVANKLIEEAPELIPVAVKALQGLLAGDPPEKVLSHAERELIAQRSQRLFDDALKNAHGKPNTGE